MLPQLDLFLAHPRASDVSHIFASTKNKLIQSSLKQGARIYALPFKNARGMVEKWIYDDKGRLVKDTRQRGLVAINPPVISLATVDAVIPFISSDEILLVKHKRDRPYNLEPALVKNAIEFCGLDENGLAFFFFTKPELIREAVIRFCSELRFILSEEYLLKPGFLDIHDPKWRKYGASEEVSDIVNYFFFNKTRIPFSKRESLKRRLLHLLE